MPSFRFPSPAIRGRRQQPKFVHQQTATGVVHSLAGLAHHASFGTTPSVGGGGAGGGVKAASGAITSSRKIWPSASIVLYGGPKLLLRGPGILLRAPGVVLRAPRSMKARTQRLFSSSRYYLRQENQTPPHSVENLKEPSPTSHFTEKVVDSEVQQEHEEVVEVLGTASAAKATYVPPRTSSTRPSTSRPPLAGPSAERKASFSSRLRQRWNETPTKWYPIPVSLGVALLVVIQFYKQRSWDPEQEEGKGKGRGPVSENEIKVKGPWQVHVIGALPLRSMSRIYGMLNSYTLPVWFRVPGYKLYSFIFGVNLDECEYELAEYRSMSEFFMRRLKPGVRPIANASLVSPADGKVVNFGTVVGGRVEQVKGSTYSLEALLAGTGQLDKSSEPPTAPFAHTPHPHNTDHADVDETEFANVNGIQYSLDDLLGPEGESKSHDASMTASEQASDKEAPNRTIAGDASVALEVAPASLPWAGSHIPKDGNKMFFAVVYLAPGDYHRFHSPASWVVERRRHFAGELFSVSPWMANKLQDLFVLNERVALLGRWRHGFFSMVPVGATNVGSIRVNFDSSLRTNSPSRPITPGTFSEATYAKASTLLGGQPLRAGDEIGGFWLGSTIVLVFEAPEAFEFSIKMGQYVKVGEKLGDSP